MMQLVDTVLVVKPYFVCRNVVCANVCLWRHSRGLYRESMFNSEKKTGFPLRTCGNDESVDTRLGQAQQILKAAVSD